MIGKHVTAVQGRGRPPKEVSTGHSIMSKLEFRALEDILMSLGRGRAQDAAAQVTNASDLI